MTPRASRHRQQITGYWIAYGDHQHKTVLARGWTADEVFEEAQKAHPETIIITQVPPEEAEIPNEDLIAAMKAADEEERSGTLTYYTTVEELMDSLK
jgi:hypothetical protein